MFRALFFDFIAFLISSFHQGTFGFFELFVFFPIESSADFVIASVKEFTVLSMFNVSIFFKLSISNSNSSVNRVQFGFFRFHLSDVSLLE